MMHHRWLIAGTVAIILGCTLATGPIGLYTIPTASDAGALGHGNATVTAVSVPETVTLKESRYHTGEYHLQVPPVVVAVETVAGSPILTYTVEIEELGTTKATIHSLGQFGEGTHRLSFADASSSGEAQITAIAQNKINQAQYEGRITVVLRGNGTKRVIADTPVTVKIVE